MGRLSAGYDDDVNLEVLGPAVPREVVETYRQPLASHQALAVLTQGLSFVHKSASPRSRGGRPAGQLLTHTGQELPANNHAVPADLGA